MVSKGDFCGIATAVTTRTIDESSESVVDITLTERGRRIFNGWLSDSYVPIPDDATVCLRNVDDDFIDEDNKLYAFGREAASGLIFSWAMNAATWGSITWARGDGMMAYASGNTYAWKKDDASRWNDGSQNGVIPHMRQFVTEHLTASDTIKVAYNYLPGVGFNAYEWQPSDNSDPEFIFIDLQQYSGTALVNDTHDYIAIITQDRADSEMPNVVTAHKVTIVKGLKGLNLDATNNPYSSGTKNHAVFDCAKAARQTRLRWAWGPLSTQEIVDTGMGQYTTILAASTYNLDLADRVFGNPKFFDNIHFDIYRSAYQYVLGKMYGVWLPMAYSVALNKAASSPYYVCVKPDDKYGGTSGIGTVICDMDMRKYTHTGNDMSTGWSVVYEGPGYTQDEPVFTEIVKLEKKGVSGGELDKFYGDTPTLFDFTGETFSPDSQSNPTYWQMSKTVGDYTCRIRFEQKQRDFNGPDGYPVTSTTWGKIWFYNIYITKSTGSLVSGEQYRISLTNS